MAMIISRNLKEEQKILANAKSVEVNDILSCALKTKLAHICEKIKGIPRFLQQEGEGTVSAMVVEKQKLDNKVKEMKDRVQVI